MTHLKITALHPSKLDIGYCQKAGDIANLKSGYWILPTEKWDIRILDPLKEYVASLIGLYMLYIRTMVQFRVLE